MATNIEYQGFKKVASTTNPLGIYCAGQKRLDFGNKTLTTEGAVSSAILFGYGTATTPVAYASAGKFISFYVTSPTTSDTVEGLYIKAHATGAGGSLNAARIFGSMTAQGADARGAHISLSFGTGNGVTGSGQALTTTLHLPNNATFTGNLSCITCELTADGSSSDPVSSTVSFIRMAINGDTTGDDDTITDATAFDWSSVGASASGSFWYDHDGTSGGDTIGEWIKVRTANGVRYLAVYDAQH